jgi:hypothetical protein
MKRNKAHFYLLGKKACRYYRDNQDKSMDKLIDKIHHGIKKYGLAMYVDGSGNLDSFMYEIMGWDDFVAIDRPMYHEMKWMTDIENACKEEGL